MTFEHSTRAQLLARLRDRYRTATGDTVARIAAFFLTATTAELQAAFGFTSTQAKELRSRLTTASNALGTVRALRGE